MKFQLFLLIALGVFFVYVLLVSRQPALRKGFVLLFVAVMLLFSAKPDWSTLVANFFGVARGADFLFYLSHLMLFFIAFLYYLKFRDVEARFARLVRHVAILEARELETDPSGGQ